MVGVACVRDVTQVRMGVIRPAYRTSLHQDVQVQWGVVPCVAAPVVVRLHNHYWHRVVVPRDTVLAKVQLLHADDVTVDSLRAGPRATAAVRVGNISSTGVDAALPTPQADLPEPRPPKYVLPPDAPLPADLQALGDGCEDVSLATQQSVYDILHGFCDVFARGDEIGLCTWELFPTDTGTNAPYRQKMKSLPLHYRDQVHQTYRDYLRQGVVEPSTSAWASNIICVPKKTGEIRPCVDLRGLNARTVYDAGPLPRIDSIFHALRGWRFFWTLDISSAYLSFLIRPEDRCKTAVLVPDLGLLQYKRLIFGLSAAPAFFSRMMHRLLNGGPDGPTGAQAYLDDVIGGGETEEAALAMLKKTLQRVRDSGMLLKAKKCALFKRQVTYLGHLLTRDGVRPDPAKVEKVLNWPEPHNAREVVSFLGLASYYLRFQAGFATLAAPLRDLTKQGVPFEWREEHQVAFDKIKVGLTTAPVLAQPQIPGEAFILSTDASATAAGSVLTQPQDGVERVIAYHSKQFSPRERNYCATSRELLSLIIAVKVFHTFLIGAHFVVKSDAQALQWLRSFKHPDGKTARWLEILSQYTFVVLYQRGATLRHADALSRFPQRPCPTACKTCRRLEEKDQAKDVALALAVRRTPGSGHHLGPGRHPRRAAGRRRDQAAARGPGARRSPHPRPTRRP